MSGPSPAHVPVLLARTVELLAPALTGPDAVAVDATLGLGGHTEALLTAHPQLRVIGLDRDPDALDLSRERLSRFGDRVELVHVVYDRLPQVLADRGLAVLDAVLFDLGVSSMQLDRPERGFSYAREAPLDMRMDPTRGLTAAEVLQTYSAEDLIRILREYGEERFAPRIARAVVRQRERRPLTSTSQLVDLIRDAVPAAARRTGGNPAKRTFQALRIEVNGELDAVRAAVPAALSALRVGGRFAALAYHSLEDRVVKQSLSHLAHDTTPPGLPVPLADAGPEVRLLTRGAEKASGQEVADNPRAASVRLRAAERIRSGRS